MTEHTHTRRYLSASVELGTLVFPQEDLKIRTALAAGLHCGITFATRGQPPTAESV